MAALGINEYGGRVVALDKDGKSHVQLGIYQHGGQVSAYDKDGETTGVAL